MVEVGVVIVDFGALSIRLKQRCCYCCWPPCLAATQLPVDSIMMRPRALPRREFDSRASEGERSG